MLKVHYDPEPRALFEQDRRANAIAFAARRKTSIRFRDGQTLRILNLLPKNSGSTPRATSR
jgi:hypothetical protein